MKIITTLYIIIACLAASSAVHAGDFIFPDIGDCDQIIAEHARSSPVDASTPSFSATFTKELPEDLETYRQFVNKAENKIRPQLEQMLGSLYSMKVFFQDSLRLKGLVKEYAEMFKFLKESLPKHPEYSDSTSVLGQTLKEDQESLKSELKRRLRLLTEKSALDEEEKAKTHRRPYAFSFNAIVKEGHVIAERCVAFDEAKTHLKGCVSFDLATQETRGLKITRSLDDKNKANFETSFVKAFNQPNALSHHNEQTIDGKSLSELHTSLWCEDKSKRVLAYYDIPEKERALLDPENEETDNFDLFKRIAKSKGLDPKTLEQADIKSFSYKSVLRDLFWLGSPLAEKGRQKDETPSPSYPMCDSGNVELETFTIQQTPVTQLQWFLVMGDNPSFFKIEHDADKDHVEINDISLNINHPVETVSWEDVQKFIAKLNKWDKRCSYRLPTEMEWEAAVRASTAASAKTAYFFGNDAGGERGTVLNQYAWFSGLSKQFRTHAVAQKKPNPMGLYDMLGNVSQWMQNAHQSYRWKSITCSIEPFSSSDDGVYDDRPESLVRSIRGGSWSSQSPEELRSAKRTLAGVAYKDNNLGFRLVRTCNINLFY